jgi:hypothetical protein
VHWALQGMAGALAQRPEARRRIFEPLGDGNPHVE